MVVAFILKQVGALVYVHVAKGSSNSISDYRLTPPFIQVVCIIKPFYTSYFLDIHKGYKKI